MVNLNTSIELTQIHHNKIKDWWQTQNIKKCIVCNSDSLHIENCIVSFVYTNNSGKNFTMAHSNKKNIFFKVKCYGCSNVQLFQPDILNDIFK